MSNTNAGVATTRDTADGIETILLAAGVGDNSTVPFLTFNTSVRDVDTFSTQPVPTAATIDLIEDLYVTLRQFRQMADFERWGGVEADFLDRHEHIEWWAKGTGDRVVVGLGEEIEGSGATIDGDLSAVAKIETVYGRQRSYRDANPHEIRVYGEAVSRGDDDLFADILGHHPKGNWLVMPQCQPFYDRDSPERTLNTYDYVNDEDGHRDSLREELDERGWEGHDLSRHGNSGLDSDGDPVLIDYGSYWEPKDEWKTSPSHYDMEM